MRNFVTVLLIMFSSSAFARPLDIIGDCLASPQGLGAQFKGANVRGVVGAGSAAIIRQAKPCKQLPVTLSEDKNFKSETCAQWTVVSSGSNDFPWGASKSTLTQRKAKFTSNLRATINRISGNVILVVPNHPVAAAVVLGEASQNNMIHTVSFKAGRDRVHPVSYKALAKSIRLIIGRD